jgi:hypothetical protein
MKTKDSKNKIFATFALFSVNMKTFSQDRKKLEIGVVFMKTRTLNLRIS